MSATLLSTMFRQLFSAFVKSVRNKMFDRFKKSKHLDIAAFVAHSDALSRDVMKAFSDGEVTVRQVRGQGGPPTGLSAVVVFFRLQEEQTDGYSRNQEGAHDHLLRFQCFTRAQASNAGTGVIQLAHRINAWGVITHLQRVSTALPKDGKYTLMRGIDATQLHCYCPAETPEGHGAGLLQNLALFARVRLGTEGLLVTSALLHAVPDFAAEHYGLSGGPSGSSGPSVPIVEPLVAIKQLAHAAATLVYVNGDPVAVTRVPESLMEVLRGARRAKVLPIDSSIIRANHGILIFADMGTVQFPVICLDGLKRHGHKLESVPAGDLFKTMMSMGIIEYIEAWEALDYRVAFSPSELRRPDLLVGLNGAPLMPYTHLAVHPMGFLGTSASSVPWSDHDQAPRVSYQAGMMKQAVSTPAMNISERFDQGYTYQLWHPQKPMADTVVSESRGLHEWPMGENLIIAIGSYDGLSQEDAIVRSQSAVDRGSGRITVSRVFKAVIHKISSSDFEAFECPVVAQNGLSCIGIRAECDYSKLDVGGLLSEGLYVKNGDVLIGRVIYTTDDSGNRVRRDRSIILTCEDTERYLVDRVMVTTNRDGFRQVRVKIRSTRVPQVGDKISDRHGQKGVIGFLARQEDLPFVADGPNAGMTPDAIVNLHR